MSGVEAIILGLVQGLTEFLPVSSSGHILLGQKLLGIQPHDDNTLFTVTVHAATVLSTIIVFRKEIWDILKGFFCGIKDIRISDKKLVCNDQTDYVLKIGVSMIPIFIVGVFFKDEVEQLMAGNLIIVGCALLLTAALLCFSDYASKPGRKPLFPTKKYRNGISYWQAMVVGIGQAIAVTPGLSRSGTTISTGLVCGVKRNTMAQFSFLMVLVPILGEAFLDLVGGEFASSEIGTDALVLGFISAFVSGLFACKVMVALVKKAKLSWFALYCLIAAIVAFYIS